jgi:branched-chain amino acid transport system substrate-binding protein
MLRDGCKLKIQEINDAGGINGKKVEMVMEDDRADATEAANVSRKLASDGSISIVIGHFNSVCSNTAKETYERKGVAMFSPASTNVNVCRGYEWSFRNLYRDDYQGTFLARYAKNILGAKKAAVFFDNDDYGKGLMEAFVNEAKNVGLETIEPISYVRERVPDFKPLVAPVKGKGVDAIFISGLYNEGALITKAIRELKIDVHILGGDGLMDDKYLEIAGDAANGAFVTTPFLFDAAKDDKDVQVFQKTFTDQFGKAPNTWAALAYDAIGMALEGIKQVGPDRKAIRDWLASITTPEKAYIGVTGPTYFDKEGDCFCKGAHVAIVKDVAFVAAEKQMKVEQ